MYGYVYLTTNLINQKKYVGQHKSPVFDENYKGSGKLLKQAFEKYGWENFKTEILEECDSQESLNNCEIRKIAELNAVSSDEYYNISGGGDGWSSQWMNPGFREFIIEFLKSQTFSEETRKKISEAGKRRYQNPEERRKTGEKSRIAQQNGGFMKGKYHSDETRQRMSKMRKGKPHVIKDMESFRRKLSESIDNHGERNPMYGKHHSEETRAKMAEQRKIHNIGCCWLNNGIEERFLKDISEIQVLIEKGYVKGRLKHTRKSSTTIESIDSKKDTVE